MGVDVCVYRERIGCFLPSSTRKCVKLKRFLFCPRVLAVVPSIRVVFALALVCSLLILSGDVEMNPGPKNAPDQPTLATLQEKLEALLLKTELNHQESLSKLSAITIGVGELSERVTSLERKVEELSGTNEEVTRVSQDLRLLEEKVESISLNTETTLNLASDLNALDNRIRRNNLVFKGIPEEPRETWARSEEIITCFVKEHLDIEAGVIERAHRAGRKNANFPRPIIVRFLSFKSKQSILENAHKLKNLESPKVWIEEDHSPLIREARRKLWDYAKTHRSPQSRVRLVFDKLFMNDKVFLYDTQTDTVVESQRSIPSRITN